MNDKNIKQQNNLEEFRKKSLEYYEEIKAELESKYNGKYIAMNYELKDYEIGDTITESLTKAREKFPGKLFYVIQAGTNATYSIQSTRNKFVYGKVL